MNISASIRHLSQLPPEQLMLRATQTLPPWVSLVLAIGLAWQLGKLVWLLVPQSEAVTSEVFRPPPSERSAASSTRSAREDAQRIANAHLFGVFNAQPRAAAEVVEDVIDASETTLNLKLLGTVASANADESMAIIVDGKGDARVVMVGGPVQQGVSLHSVFPEWVHLERGGGKIEKLSLPMETDLKGADAPRRSTRSATRTARSTSASSSNTLSQALADAGPKKLTDLIRPQPVFADGKQLGYRVYPGRNRQQFSKLGLKPGDLVTQINGTALNDPAKGLEIFRALEDSSQVSVTVERNGQATTVMLDTSILTGDGGGS